jgi:hypothetical protein
MQQVKVIENFFEKDEIKFIKDYSEEFLKEKENLISDKSRWDPRLNTSQGEVKIYVINRKIDSELFDLISNKTKKVLNMENPLMYFYYWENNSNINWHTDPAYLGGATIYLNKKWDRDWGGYFIYEKDKKLGVEIPSFNKCVFQFGSVPHATTPLSNGAPIRKTLQIFFKK